MTNTQNAAVADQPNIVNGVDVDQVMGVIETVSADPALMSGGDSAKTDALRIGFYRRS